MAQVIKAFYDGSTGRLYRKGDEYNDDRADDLAAGGYIAAPRKPKKADKPAEPATEKAETE